MARIFSLNILSRAWSYTFKNNKGYNFYFSTVAEHTYSFWFLSGFLVVRLGSCIKLYILFGLFP